MHVKELNEVFLMGKGRTQNLYLVDNHRGIAKLNEDINIKEKV